ncbi:putative Heat shock protein 70 family [Rosa chinensis]|uniref:Putative Heat shock protein 70 family n=1 Tax=Rosa chinensis TaxID=74649 RepID=A0A2P6R746_ROSCH|nr:putative Heat shock protein 70 family [Rosa chinensis]
MILTKMMETAEAYLGKKIKYAVITVPAYFNDAQRQATKDAGKIAGLKVDRHLLTIDDGVIEVISTSGGTHLGGEDFNHRVMEYLIKLIKKKYNRDISKDNKALWKLHRACETANGALFFLHQLEIETLQDGGLKNKDIHDIVLAGGSTKIPKGLNPDEVAAYGASVHGGVLSGEAEYDTHNSCILRLS